MKKKTLITLLTLLIVFSSTVPVLAYRPQDVKSNHWALKYISPLLDKGIMYVYQNGAFKPDQPITRGEFAYSLAKILQLQPAATSKMTDISNHPAKGYISALVKKEIITGYPDNTFRPHRKITRAEIITMLGRTLQLDDEQKKITVNSIYYSDLSKDHWAYNLIAVSTKLGIINGYPNNEFRPDNYVTRAESAKLLAKLASLKTVTGKVVATYPISNFIKIKVNNKVKTIKVADSSLIGRNNRKIGLKEMLVSDNIFVIINPQNEIIYLKAYGLIKKEDVAKKVSNMTDGLLNTDQIIAISNQNWDAVVPSLRQKLTMSLLNQGLTAQEVHTILNKDWDKLEKLGKARLIEAIALNTNISPKLIKAAANKNWDKAKKLAEVTAINGLLNQFMTNSNLFS
ncbi:putative S-layer protein [Halobacteroides halobius DSM 5150]|uniref:Putative S-layer protein n=1 Tax=Halobacteroides halobius (strain ATCC 35273 / DSM 5150 / MD-1) TaxID=748449 RepID=L0K7U0_HALHC|nr:S-layer homology domain-containing protein [Halobacteroides halobius]AGB40419.1 putative S-layer protein [Halobacteroides halobius DSM 5150]